MREKRKNKKKKKGKKKEKRKKKPKIAHSLFRMQVFIYSPRVLYSPQPCLQAPRSRPCPIIRIGIYLDSEDTHPFPTTEYLENRHTKSANVRWREPNTEKKKKKKRVLKPKPTSNKKIHRALYIWLLLLSLLLTWSSWARRSGSESKAERHARWL